MFKNVNPKEGYQQKRSLPVRAQIEVEETYPDKQEPLIIILEVK
jgi:hypothetical protein